LKGHSFKTLVAIEVHYSNKNPEMFSSKNVFSLPLRK